MAPFPVGRRAPKITSWWQTSWHTCCRVKPVVFAERGRSAEAVSIECQQRPRAETDFQEYVSEIVDRLRATPPARTPATVPAEGSSQAVYEVLTSRPFTYLSRSRNAAYRDRVLRHLDTCLANGRQAGFFLDVGPGYHASLDPARASVSFGVGLAEVLLLLQVRAFLEAAGPHFPNGIRFHLVIDNLCGQFVNGVPLASTEAYCEQLRDLIRFARLEEQVDLLVESEQLEADAYRAECLAALARETAREMPSAEQIRNVERFVGTPLRAEDAQARLRRHRAATTVTEHHLARIVDGVRMTQRATEETFPFRSYPGGDSRIQCGEVALTRNRKGAVHPVLVTARTFDEYAVQEWVDVRHHGIPHVQRIRRVE
jgi:hypothetical protein